MSRCFPYPPPGFNGKRAIDEALIQAIKLQKDLEKATTLKYRAIRQDGSDCPTKRRKEKKREKKEKRRETKKHKETANLTLTGIAYEEYAHKGGKSCTKLIGGDNNKRKQEDAEQLERSDITEEHGQPLSLQNPGYSSDSTQNSNKRRKQATSVNVDNSRGHGNILRIRLPLQKKHKEPAISASKEQHSSPSGRKGQHKESDVSASKEQICYTSGSKDLLGHCGHDVDRRTSQDDICCSLPGNVVQGLSFGPDKELSCSTSGRTEGLALDENRINEMQKIDFYTKFLIQNLVPPALPSDLSNIDIDDDDDEWLFRRKHSDGAVEKRFKASSDVSCCGSSASWPHAQYLAEAEIYALPYTVPF